MPAYIDDTRKAAGLLRQLDRIMVIGCSGGGKSTLSQKLSSRLDLPYFSMDKEFFWLPGWVKRSKDEERRLITEVVAGKRWLMDGTGPSTFDLRVPRAQLVVWVRMPRLICLWGICKRVIPLRQDAAGHGTGMPGAITGSGVSDLHLDVREAIYASGNRRT
ncbi:hypothetical protein BN77_2737 [Rhizobium mesoamericanum STM3625]|uniref:DNA topology modulation kinase FlaR-like protein n=1 Tax=Rhizobium mesoamericanum STM3625 TaxID=1211777 RepID=K0PGH5_9HYPH|nr:hypothetical protein BN77_2737 [Rhizobium mesoamericanum STM3625]